jgi:serine/threonine protein kinase
MSLVPVLDRQVAAPPHSSNMNAPNMESHICAAALDEVHSIVKRSPSTPCSSPLTGYHAHYSQSYRLLTTIHESSTTFVYRAERERDRRPVILKILKQEAVTASALARYRHEFEVLERLRLPGVVEILGIEMVQGSPMLVFVDCGASSLAKLQHVERFNLEQLLALAARIAEALGQLHDHGIAHGDLNPSNILLEKSVGILKIGDFGSSWQLSGEPQAGWNAPGCEGTLPYMSPEQTGRMNRIVDHRTDFYSLGVTLYELFTGRLPFATNDPVQLVHSHLARQPVPAHELHPALPAALSDIIAKLMAKMPEDRYQNALGCAHDLQECQRQLQAHGEISRFPLGRGDHVERFEIASRLYGREEQSAALREAFVQAHAGTRVLALIAGHAGIGKSALVKDFRASITETRSLHRG